MTASSRGHSIPAVSQASNAQEALQELDLLCADITHFIAQVAPRAQYRAPIIDWHHAGDYAQKDIAGLRKFLAAAEAERQYVEGVSCFPAWIARTGHGKRGARDIRAGGEILRLAERDAWEVETS